MKSIIDVYSEIYKSNPKWSAEEERKFIEQWWEKDREHFVNEAMKHNLGIVFESVQKLSFKNDIEDVFQKGVIALVDSLRRYKPSKGYRISTWVTSPVRWAIMQHQNPYNHQGSINDEITSLNYKYGSKMSVVSIDSKVGGEDGDGDTIGDMITEENVSKNYPTSFCKSHIQADLDKDIDISDGVSEMLDYIPKLLTYQELDVIKRMLNGKNMTEISVELNLSRMRISQISAKAFDKIRRCKISKKLKGLVEEK